MHEKNKGITLISLIITVLLLLVLTGISIFEIQKYAVTNKAKNVVKRANNQIKNASEMENEVIENTDSPRGAKSATNID